MPVPLNPRIGQLYYDHPTGTMRRWNGKHWQETSTREIRNVIKENKKRAMDSKASGNKT